jgi:hypothetical protein
MPNPAREETVLGGEVRRLASCHARHGNASIGKCHQSDGNFERALVLHLQAREISETLAWGTARGWRWQVVTSATGRPLPLQFGRLLCSHLFL